MSKDLLIKGLTFAAGAAIGSAVTWQLLKIKYEQKIDEEVDSVKKAFSEWREELKQETDISEEPVEDTDNNDGLNETIREAEKIAKKSGYTNYSNNYSKEEEKDMKDGPYVITPEEFGELDNYKTISLTYYTDGVLTDDFDNIIDDIDDTVGLESLDTFGQYEDDSVFVRNDARKCDYEILMDYRTYDEAFPDMEEE